MKTILLPLFLLAGCASTQVAQQHLRLNIQCGRMATLNEIVRVSEMSMSINLEEVEIVDNKVRCYMEIYEEK